jgi:hypothetical protein
MKRRCVRGLQSKRVILLYDVCGFLLAILGFVCDCLQLLSGAKAASLKGSVAGQDTGKGFAVEKAKTVQKESELQAAEEALQNLLKRQASAQLVKCDVCHMALSSSNHNRNPLCLVVM